MRFYTASECENWLSARQRHKPDEVANLPSHSVPYPKEPYQIYGHAHWIATNLAYRQPALLWITEYGIWPSSENLHLYYRLRQSYADHRLLHDAPGHLFLGHETEDLASFLQLSMLNGWGGYLLTQADYTNLFFSHDGALDFYATDPTSLDEVRCALDPGNPAK